MGSKLPHERRYLSREEFDATYGADDNDLKKIETFAHEHDLTVVEFSRARRTVVLSGTIADVSKAFGVYLANYEHPEGTFRGRTGSIYVPEEIADIVQGVFGLDNRRQARPHFRRFKPKESISRASTIDQGYYPPQVAKLYDFPSDVNGTGECIAILEFGGGYTSTELNTYFNHLGIDTPQISAVSVDHVHNQPNPGDDSPENPDGEVMLDIEVAGAVAPGAQIVVYFAPYTEQGCVDVITKAVHDDIHKPSVISISWGFAEFESADNLLWSEQAMTAVNEAFQAAAAMGVTVCVATGDDGSRDQIDDGLVHVDFPSSSPYSLACGGTKLEGSGSTISSEVVWNESPETQDHSGATGGGISDKFDLPVWQKNANIPSSANPGGHIGRGVPDVAAKADMATGYIILADGQTELVGGTSAASQLWAGLSALLNKKLGKSIGYLNPVIYSLKTSDIFHNITEGDNNVTDSNGPYQAHSGWNACTGWGSPDGAKLLSALSGQHMTKKKVTHAPKPTP
jgi:kumamolisin